MTGFLLKVEISPSALEMKPGDSAQLLVKVTNVSDIVEHYQLRIAGLPSDDYWSSEKKLLKLRPGDSGTSTVTITLPMKNILISGHYPLSVVAASRDRPTVSRAADLALEVGAVSGITIEAKPTTATGKREATFALWLTNDGTVDFPVAIQGSDDRGLATITPTPPALHVPPGGAQPAQVAVKVKPLFTGKERPFAIAIKAVAGGETRGQVPVTFTQTPLIPLAVIRVIGIVLALAIMVGAILVAAGVIPIGGEPDGPEPSSDPPQSSTSTSGGSTTPTSPPPTSPPATNSTPSESSAELTVSEITIDPEPPFEADTKAVLSATSPSATTWEWTIKAPDNTEQKFPTKEISHTFTQVGTHTVSLTVKNAADQAKAAEPRTVEVTEKQPRFAVVPKPFSVGAGQPLQDFAACAPGFNVVGGGVDITPDEAAGSVEIKSSIGTEPFNEPTRWSVSLLNRGDGTVTGAIQAVCARDVDGYTVKGDTDIGLEPDTTDFSRRQCPGDKVALGGGGGVMSSEEVATILELSQPLKQDGVHKWLVRARNATSDTQAIRVQVICADEPPEYEVVPSEETVVEPGTNVPVVREAICPPDTVAVSGGAGIGGAGIDDNVYDENTSTVLRESAVVADPSGERWVTRLSVTALEAKTVIGYAVCANLPR